MVALASPAKVDAMNQDARAPRWGPVYVVTVIYGVLTLVGLWLFTRAYTF